MAEPGSFADRVKQQADIVRIVGEYVPLKKAGQSYRGLCPFHEEKTPSFNVHPTKQIYHCFGCGQGGDVFKFVMEKEKCSFPEAIRMVAEKCGIAIPRPKERSPEEHKENQQRAVLGEIHRQTQSFFVKQIESTLEGKAARAYLEDRGLDKEAIGRFGIGYAPTGGDTLLRHLKSKYSEALLAASGLVSRSEDGRMFDRFRRRIMFPIANESSKIIAYGGRALGDDQPKYLNSPETPIYSKSNVLYHLDRAKEAIRRQGFTILVEGYMDAIAVARAGFSNVVATCGTSLARPQAKRLKHFTSRVVMNYDPDTAGQSATERSIVILLEEDLELYAVVTPRGSDPDKFIREQGAAAYKELVLKPKPYIDFIIERFHAKDLSTREAKVEALNFFTSYLYRMPSPFLRSEWASRIAAHLHLDDPVLRAALSKAAAQRHSELKIQPELVGRSAKPVERRLIRMLAEAEGFRRELAQRLQAGQLHHGLETEKVFAALIVASLADEPVQATEVATKLEERDRRMLFEILFEEASEPTWEEAVSCVEALQHRQAERELADVQRSIEANPPVGEMRGLLEKKQDLMRRLAAAR
jgi:DNA primase